MPGGKGMITFDLAESFLIVPTEVLSHDSGYAAGACEA